MLFKKLFFKNLLHDVNHKYIYIFILILLIIAGSFLSFFISTKPHTPKSVAVDKPAHADDLVNFSRSTPFWWDNNYGEFIQIGLNNTSKRNTITKGQYVEFKYNHQLLVSQNESNPDASDFEMVYGEQNVKRINFNVTNPNTTETVISFLVENDIKNDSYDSSYYLYFNNKKDQNVDFVNIPRDILSSDLKVSNLGKHTHPLSLKASRKWVIKDKSLADNLKNETLSLKIDKDVSLNPEFSSQQTLELIIPQAKKTFVLNKVSPDTFSVLINSANLDPGSYDVQAKVRLKDTDFLSEKIQFNVSYPLYVTWSIDWEGYDVNNEYLDQLAELSKNHGIPMTHFFNPRIYTSGLSEIRKKFLTDWVRERMNIQKDEIGLHLHMFKDMVSSSGIVPKSQPDWGKRNNDGYSTLTTAYSSDEFAKMIKWSKDQFQKNNLPEPKSYRAGGWFINSSLLKVLSDFGFNYDSSGREAYYFGVNPQKGLWNLKSTTHPYMPNINDQNSSAPANLNLWEFPNNGLDSTNNTETVLIQKFKDNFNNLPLGQSQVLTYCTHPHWLKIDKPRLDKLFNTIDPYNTTSDNGPIVYSTLNTSYLAYTKQ